MLYKYFEKKTDRNIEIFDSETEIKIGFVQSIPDEDYNFMAVPIGNNKKPKKFMILHCAIGYIGACTYRITIKPDAKQLNLDLWSHTED